MARFKKLIPKEKVGKIVYSSGIIENIVELTVTEIDEVELCSIGIGVDKNSKKKLIDVVFDKKGVHVNVSVKMGIQNRVPDMAFKIQESIRHNIESMTDYHVLSVNVNVDGLLDEKIVSAHPTTQEN